MPYLPIPFDNTYAQLPDIFYARQLPKPVAAPGLIKINEELAELLGIELAFLKSDDCLLYTSDAADDS